MRLLISSEISAGLSCMLFPDMRGLAWRSGVSATLHLFQTGRTEVSSTSSPTTTRMPPISSGSTDLGLELATEALLQRATTSASCAGSIGKALVDHRVGHPELVVDQRPELRAISGSAARRPFSITGRRKLLTLGRQRSWSRTARHQIEHLGGADLGVVGELRSCSLPATAASLDLLRQRAGVGVAGL
jgi:hypothetical protein